MDYNQTVHLPQTDFPMRAGLPMREPGMLEEFDRKEIYRKLMGLGSFVQSTLSAFSFCWLLLYVGFALFLLVQEYLSITVSFFRRQFSRILVTLVAVTALYILYCGQDPGQRTLASPGRAAEDVRVGQAPAGGLGLQLPLEGGVARQQAQVHQTRSNRSMSTTKMVAPPTSTSTGMEG